MYVNRPIKFNRIFPVRKVPHVFQCWCDWVTYIYNKDYAVRYVPKNVENGHVAKLTSP